MDSLTVKIAEALPDTDNDTVVKPRIKAKPKQHRDDQIAAYRHRRMNRDRMSRSELIRHIAEEVDPDF